MKKLLSVLLVVVMAAVMLLTCASAEEQMVITMITSMGRPEEEASACRDAFWARVDTYEERTGVHIEWEVYPDQTAYQEKLYTLAAANDLPDLYRMKGSWMTEFVNNEWILDITDYLDEEFMSIFQEGMFSNHTRDGRIYAVPDENMTTGVVFYNAKLWKEAGYDSFPTDWDTLIEAAGKFKEMGITEFVLGNKANWPAESCWFSSLADHGTDTAWTEAILKKDGSAAYTDEGVITALTKFQELALTEGAFNPDINSIDENEARELFMNEKAATLVEGTWYISTLEATAPEMLDDVELAILPSWDGAAGNPNAVSGGPAWAMALSPNAAESEEKLQACIDFLKDVYGLEMGKAALEAGGIVAISTEFDDSNLGPIMLKYLDMMADKETVPIWDACMEAGVINTFNVGLQEVLIGAKTPQELADETQMEYEMACMG